VEEESVMENLEAPKVDLLVWGGGDIREAEVEERQRQGFITGVGVEGKCICADGWGGSDGGRGVRGGQDGMPRVVHGGVEESREWKAASADTTRKPT
jgi:hypothetical protein